MGALGDRSRALAGPAVRERPPVLVRPLAVGLLAGMGLLSFYLGLLSLAQGWSHALAQLAEDRWFVGAIAARFGHRSGRLWCPRTPGNVGRNSPAGRLDGSAPWAQAIVGY